ncbi:MAG: glycerol kinase, partial [Chloroflexi bacterium]|nr:glycerol kinase [Chloroflexota bacterium]
LGVVRGVMGIPSGVPVAAMVGDSHAALFGHAAFAPGLVKATYGTGSSLMTATPNLVHSARGLSTSVAFGHEKAVYALEGNIYTTGAAVEWLADLLGLGSPAALEAMAASESRGVYFVPALVGLGAPHWRDDARGTISGLARGSTRAELARAGLEAVGYQIRDVFDCMAQEAGTPLTALLADGGATRNGSLMQFQADILGVPVLVSQVAEVSALGAAYLAGLTVGLWPSREAVAALDRPQVRFEPRISSERRAALYAGWQQALGRTLWSKAPEAEEGQ